MFRRPSPARKPVWRWPNELPIAGEPADVIEIVEGFTQKLQQSNLPKLLFHATPGALIQPALVEWAKAHLKNLKAVALGEGIHYLQEDEPHRIGRELADWYRSL